MRGRNRWDLLWAGEGYLKQVSDTLEPGDTLRASEIAQRSGVPRTRIHDLLYWMEKRGMVERVPVAELLPPRPDVWEYWPESRRRRWRARHLGKCPPRYLWRYVGILPIHPDTLLATATKEDTE